MHVYIYVRACAVTDRVTQKNTLLSLQQAVNTVTNTLDWYNINNIRIITLMLVGAPALSSPLALTVVFRCVSMKLKANLKQT